ncbi:hypothetical protein ANDA3_0521 [plant metagenome]|uniref:Uncharacterized protein n=1 Tax=plant metagenome TaxID=1297885 RepID=A0A484TSA6_9ZZZZ
MHGCVLDCLLAADQADPIDAINVLSNRPHGGGAATVLHG